jgi:hypothetical protein
VRRWSFSLLAAIALISSGARAFEPVAEDGAAQEAGVVVSAIPAPAAVTQLLQPAAGAPKLRASVPVRKAKVAKAQPVPKSLLSRSERQQLALRASSGKLSGVTVRKFFDDEDQGSGLDELVLHRSFARPRVQDEPQREDDDAALAELPATVKLRLLMARMQALEAQALVAAGDRPDGAEMTEEVKLRLFLARSRALEAHRKLHG